MQNHPMSLFYSSYRKLMGSFFLSYINLNQEMRPENWRRKVILDKYQFDISIITLDMGS